MIDSAHQKKTHIENQPETQGGNYSCPLIVAYPTRPDAALVAKPATIQTQQ
jgi:hypothetical protein